jgi:hypothetical protein
MAAILFSPTTDSIPYFKLPITIICQFNWGSRTVRIEGLCVSPNTHLYGSTGLVITNRYGGNSIFEITVSAQVSASGFRV